MTVAPRRPPGRPSGGKLLVDREVLLDAAERVIARDGHSASLEAIAVEAGVTKPIVYARVGSRAELSDALAQRLADRINAAASAVVVAVGPPDRSTLAALFGTILETIGAHGELFSYVTRGTAGDAPERALFLAARNAAPLAELVAHWRTERELDPVVAEPWAYAIIGMLNLVSLWWMESRQPPASVVAEQLADLVWPGLHAGR